MASRKRFSASSAKQKPSELRRLAVAYYGATGWRGKLAEHMMVDRVTTYRWEKGGAPESVLVALRCLIDSKRLDRKP